MKKQTAGRAGLGDLAPKFAELNDDVLFGEVWSREDKLSTRDRSLLTVVALMTKGIFDNSFKYHVSNARNHSVTKVEMVEAITHLAFYIGWPNAWAAFPIVREVYKEDELVEGESLFGKGEENVAYNKYFIGKSYLKPLSTGSSLNIANVTFEPGCRNNWHIHHSSKNGGQILLCTDGEGWYQEENKEARSLKAGDVVIIPPNVKHWHGAKKSTWFTHIAIEVPGDDASTEWCEEVDDEEYSNLE